MDVILSEPAILFSIDTILEAIQIDNAENIKPYLDHFQNNNATHFEILTEIIYKAIASSSLKVLKAIILKYNTSKTNELLGFKNICLFPYAIKEGKIDVIEMLLTECDMSPLYTDFFGNNLFHMAAQYTKGEITVNIFKLFLDYSGEDGIKELYQENRFGNRPIQILNLSERCIVEDYVEGLRGMFIKEPYNQ